MSRRAMIPFGLLAAGLLGGCGSTVKPVAGSVPPQATTAGRAKVDDPRTKHINCLRQHKIVVRRSGKAGIAIGEASDGPRVVFEPTPGAAQELQIDGQVQGAEVVGSALLYPGAASDSSLKVIEDCVSEGVAG